MTRSSEEIEREVEATRGELDRTLDALKDKLTPGQLVDELTSALKGAGKSDIFANLGSQVRDNPLALAMVGAGMAWLMTGKGARHEPVTSPESLQSQSLDSLAGVGESYSTTSYDAERGPGLKERASDLAAKAADKVGEVKHRVADTAHHAAQGLGEKASQASHSAQRSFTNVLEQEPLIVGALGLAVGMAVGAALPSTPVEDRTFGAARDDLLEKGKAAGEHIMGDAKSAVSAAVEGAREEADRQGLLGSEDGGSLVEKAEQVVRAGVEAGRGEVEAGRSH